ncbi:MAG: deoxyribodipyrimidine photo-lyase [Solirubrobacteraceae bacterium]
MGAAILWFRRDLRTEDLPALAAAADAEGDAVVPLFVVDPKLLRPAGPNRRRFLAASLRALDDELGGTLVLRRGDPRVVVAALAEEIGASLVAATADFGPYGAVRDAAVAAQLAAAGRRLTTVDSSYSVPPGTLRAASGSPFRIYSAFRRALETRGWPSPVARPDVAFAGARSDTTLEEIAAPARRGESCALPDWWAELPLGAAASLPPAGPRAARERLETFAAGPLSRYAQDRDRPAIAATSGLSPHLHLGAIHPRTVAARLTQAGAGAQRMRDELAWRDFYADVLWHQPQSARHPLQAFGEHLRWDAGPDARERFAAWACGRTGFPLVDAGMRQLLAEGFMHNRVRMVSASFLVKDLHIDWRLGARWFMWHLVDGDLASNQHGWQWVAGTGTDAAPFHRVLNPELQRRRFDPDGAYVARYLATPGALARHPIVDHARERLETLARFSEARRGAANAAGAPEPSPA